MGQQLTQMVKDPKKGRELQRIYDTALSAMIINLIVAFLPQTGLGWIPFFGGWIQFVFVLLSLTFSILIYRMSNRFLPEYYGRSLNRAHLIFYILVTLICLGGSIAQTDGSHKYNKCLADASSRYYDNYRTTTSCYTPAPYYQYTTISSMATYTMIQEPAYCTTQSTSSNNYYYYGGYYDCYRLMYSTASVIMNNIMVPIFSFIGMVLLSIQCSYLWNEASSQARKLAGSMQMMPMTVQAVSMTTPTGQHQVVVPASTFNAFAQWAATNSVAQQDTQTTLPAYAPPMTQIMPAGMYAIPPNVPVATSSAAPAVLEDMSPQKH